MCVGERRKAPRMFTRLIGAWWKADNYFCYFFITWPLSQRDMESLNGCEIWKPNQFPNRIISNHEPLSQQDMESLISCEIRKSNLLPNQIRSYHDERSRAILYMRSIVLHQNTYNRVSVFVHSHCCAAYVVSSTPSASMHRQMGENPCLHDGEEPFHSEISAWGVVHCQGPWPP